MSKFLCEVTPRAVIAARAYLTYVLNIENQVLIMSPMFIFTILLLLNGELTVYSASCTASAW